MIVVENKSNCCGCHACYNICPKNAIKMQEDEKGFKYPIIDKDKCIQCNLCEKVCPVLKNSKIENKPIAFACYNKDEEIRKNSSSGGIFTLLAEEILAKNGVVFGVTFNKTYNVCHTYVENKNELEKFRGSKYVQSSINDTYKKAKEFLENGRYVLFTGTPCQIEGLKSFLRKDYDNLYTQDIICHGVPSPKVHNKFIKFLEKNGNIMKLAHRTKINGWKNWNVKVEFKNAEDYIKDHGKDIYMQAFLRNTSLRDSCYNCSFKKKNRISDITLADFWGIENILPEMDDNKGTSLVIVNSKKGQELFNEIKEKTICKEADLDEAIKYNQSMISSANMDKNREKFFENLDKIEFDKLVKKYTYRPNIIKKVAGKIKRIIKKL